MQADSAKKWRFAHQLNLGPFFRFSSLVLSTICSLIVVSPVECDAHGYP
jgi:hypothetical protein